MMFTELYPWWCENEQNWMRLDEDKDGKCLQCGGTLVLSQQYHEDQVWKAANPGIYAAIHLTMLDMQSRPEGEE